MFEILCSVCSRRVGSWGALRTGGRFNIKTPSFQYRDSHYNSETKMRILIQLARRHFYVKSAHWLSMWWFMVTECDDGYRRDYLQNILATFRLGCKPLLQTTNTRIATIFDRPFLTILNLTPVDSLWCHRSESTLVRVMACCLTAPSHYLNQYSLTDVARWHSTLRGQFHGNCSRCPTCLEITLLEISLHLPGVNQCNIFGPYLWNTSSEKY